MAETKGDYCPIKTQDGKCGAGGECNHINCWEKMHYINPSEAYKEKMLKWIEVRRGDESRWRNKK